MLRLWALAALASFSARAVRNGRGGGAMQTPAVQADDEEPGGGDDAGRAAAEEQKEAEPSSSSLPPRRHRRAIHELNQFFGGSASDDAIDAIAWRAEVARERAGKFAIATADGLKTAAIRAWATVRGLGDRPGEDTRWKYRLAGTSWLCEPHGGELTRYRCAFYQTRAGRLLVNLTKQRFAGDRYRRIDLLNRIPVLRDRAAAKQYVEYALKTKRGPRSLPSPFHDYGFQFGKVSENGDIAMGGFQFNTTSFQDMRMSMTMRGVMLCNWMTYRSPEEEEEAWYW